MKKILLSPATTDRAMIAIYFVVFSTAAAEKVTRTSVPDWFLNQFQPTFLARIPYLLEMSFMGIAATELILAMSFLIALLSPKDPRRSQLLTAALLVSTLLFTALSFGQRLTQKYDGAAFLFIQAILTAFVLLNLQKSQGKDSA